MPLHDIRLAFRQLLATPVVTSVAVLSLALGIGANTAIFSLVDSLVLRALPVKNPAELALIAGPQGTYATALSYRVWREIEARRDLFAGAYAWSTVRFNLAERGETDPVDGLWTSAGIFEMLGVTPTLGRAFVSSDDRPGGGPDGAVAVISHAFWQRRFGGALDVVGRRLTVERTPFTIVGITPPDFFGPDVGRRFDVALPLGAEPLVRGRESNLDEPWTRWLSVMVRLKPSQSIATGTAALRAILPQVRAATLPADGSAEEKAAYLKDPYSLIAAASGSSLLRERYQRPLTAILLVVAVVLLVACANIANLLLARAAARRHEMSVRLALGASRGQLVRQLLVESLVLAVAGAGLGLLFARAGNQVLIRQISTQINVVFLDLPLDWRVLAFTAVVTVATVVLFGVAPAFAASRTQPIDALKEHGPAARGTRRPGALNTSSALIVAQVALSLVLLVAAGLFLRSFATLAQKPLGFEPNRLLVVGVGLQRAAAAPSQRVTIAHDVLDAVRGVPGVEHAALSRLIPIGSGGWNGRFEVVGGTPLTGREQVAFRNMVSPGWFAAFGTPLLAGRDFTDRDRTGSAHVAIVNQAFVRRFLGGVSPLGRTLRKVDGNAEPPLEIVGLVGDAAYQSVRAPAPPTVYIAIGSYDAVPPLPSVNLSVRAASGPPALLARSVAAAIAGVHPDLTVTFRPLSDQINASLTQDRVLAILSAFFGALALLLAAIGLYGVTSYAVTRQRTEIGIRMALGATPGSVMRLVLRRVSMLMTAGITIGAGVSVWASAFAASLLYGIEPRDPAALAGAVATLAAIGALAAWLPARRASRIDPVQVLKSS